MTTGTGDIAGPATAADAVRNWQAVRASSEIQFAPVHYPEVKPPSGWLYELLKAIGEFLGRIFSSLAEAIGISWPVLQWILIALGVVLLLLLAWRMLEPLLAIRRAKHEDEGEEWAPDKGEARLLLEEADRLAAEGRFGEAAHLLLQRSVAQIAAARPHWLGPASTAREIASLPSLPERARGAFATIAERVERSLFALRALELADWQATRAAYADFALSDFDADLAGAAT